MMDAEAIERWETELMGHLYEASASTRTGAEAWVWLRTQSHKMKAAIARFRESPAMTVDQMVDAVSRMTAVELDDARRKLRDAFEKRQAALNKEPADERSQRNAAAPSPRTDAVPSRR